MVRCVMVVLVCLPILGGCSVRNDPNFNRYSPERGALRVADEFMETAEQAVRDFDMRMEFALY